jgi:hypothetical protein
MIFPNGVQRVTRDVEVHSSDDRDRDTSDAVGVANADGEAQVLILSAFGCLGQEAADRVVGPISRH